MRWALVRWALVASGGFLLLACSSAHELDAGGEGMDSGVDAAIVDAGVDAGLDAAQLPVRDGDVPCESDRCLEAGGFCCPRPDGTWYCCGGTSSCDYDAGTCECYGQEPCGLRQFCCGPNDGGVPIGECVGFDTYNRLCDPGHSSGG